MVHGSEDGALGVYTNKKLAYEKAIGYITENEPIFQPFLNVFKYTNDGELIHNSAYTVKATYNNVCKELPYPTELFQGNLDRESYQSNCSATITEFYLNN